MVEQPQLQIKLLGDFCIIYRGQVMQQGRRARHEILLAYLLIHRATPTPRQRLAFLFWPDTNDNQARTNFRKLIFRLRQKLPFIEKYLKLEEDELAFRQNMPIWLDIDIFEKEIELAGGQENIPHLQAALKRYKGDLLPDLYEDWILPPREQLRQKYLKALETLAVLLEQRGNYDEAIEETRRLLREDPLMENSYLRLMRLQALNHDIAGALRTYHVCVTQLDLELGIEPGPEVQEAYELLLKRQAFPERNPFNSSPLRLPLIGRDEAWQSLLSAWRTAATGKPQVVILSGEAGIGKTRLAEELLIWAGRQGINTIWANCFIQLEELPYGPVAEWLRSDPAQKIITDLAPRWRNELIRFLPELLAETPDQELPSQMIENWQRQHLFMAITEAVMAVGEPLLIILDDLHWADIHTLDWLQFFLRQKRGARILLLTTVRTGEEFSNKGLAAWEQELTRTIHVQNIYLERLDAKETMELADQIAASETVEVSKAVYEETEGNPLFIVEMVRAGLKNTEIALTAKVRTVIDVRLNQLSLSSQELVGLAAVIGRSFTFPLLAAASPHPEQEILQDIDELWQRRIFREQGEDAYDFSHDKIREVALTRLSHARQKWWHRRVAQALIQTNENDLEGVNNQIAAHLEVAGEPRQAAHYYLQAAQAAANLYAYREAIDYLERAIGLVPEDTPKQAEIYAQEGNAYTALGDHDQAATKYTRAAEAASGSLEKVSYLCQCIRAMSAQTRHPEAETVYQAGMELLNHLPKTEWGTDRWAAWIRLQLAVLDSFYYQGKSHEMQDLCEMLVIPLDAYGAPRQHAEYLAFLVRTRFIENRYRATSEDIENKKAALEWAQQTADPNFILEFEFSLGFSLLWAGQVTDAIDKLEATSVKADVLGNIPLQNRCLTYLAIAQRMKGDPVRVQQTLMRVVSVAETEGYQVYLGVLEANWAWLAWQAGDWEALKKHGQSAQVYWKSSKNFYPFQWLLNFPLLAYEVGQGSLAGVCSYARALLDPHQQRLPDSISLVLESALQADSPETAVAHLKEATRFAQELGYL